MDLRLNAEQRAFRDEVRTWLTANVPPEPLPHFLTPDGFAANRGWERKLAEAGYAAVQWPREYGGRDADLITQAIFEEEYSRAGAPMRVNVQGINLIGPTLMTFGTAAQKQRWIPRILTWEDVWAQGFSEPDAGSDLASLRSRGNRVEGGYVLNGQKIWSSLGDRANWLFALVRTEPELPRHQGITFVLVDMAADGVEARPIKQVNGDTGFSEIFLNDVFVPDAQVVGRPGQGWSIAMETLAHERGLGRGIPSLFEGFLADLRDLMVATGAAGDPLARARLGGLIVRSRAYRYYFLHRLSRLAGGADIGAEASEGKLFWSELEADIFDAGLHAMGPYAHLSPEAPRTFDPGPWQRRYWHSRAAKIYAGTSEVQLNVIAERVLKLPREPRGV